MSFVKIQRRNSEHVSPCNLSSVKLGILDNNFTDDDEVRFVLDQHAELDFNSASSLKQQSAGRHIAPLGHNILIPKQPVFLLDLLIFFHSENNHHAILIKGNMILWWTFCLIHRKYVSECLTFKTVWTASMVYWLACSPRVLEYGGSWIRAPVGSNFNADSAIFQQYDGENKLIINEMMMRSVLY
jgi:hypothetical protein